ncbi:GTPase-activating Rap/Ran-GAP domain-like protein 3 [Galemys pyrenaicus]|uniref:GTPase-activating Rap/Ran-GAP domain-like protein 3 n=1 Tax=Galemys pyrenaicus TaxID=202257 RepID=A0A8J6DKG3_GALPY|nr:GTPase-activating Rap/Ran-GAP domain-like protein 3 [Galemys pyrenaicus]
MDPLAKGPGGSQMAQTLLWKAKSSLSFGIQPLQTWPTKDPEVESQVNLAHPVPTYLTLASLLHLKLLEAPQG